MAIPTKAQVAAKQAESASAQATANFHSDVKFFTDAIVEAMNSGQKSFTDRIRNVSADVEQQLKTDFGNEWTIQVHNARTGCSISWS